MVPNVADVMVVVRRSVFDWYDRREGPLGPGKGPLRWSKYESNHPLLDEYLVDGDRIFLVTARPDGQLWLVAVYEDVKRTSKGWVVRGANKTRIVDLSDLKKNLRFSSGKGLSADPSKLGRSLQTPRKLTAADIGLLEAALEKTEQRLIPARIAVFDDEIESEEGERILIETKRYLRDRKVVDARLRLDAYTCQHCGFVVNAATFPKVRGMSVIVTVHHVRPLHDGKRKTKPSDLVTLCPTCHAVGHAIARALGDEQIELSLLAKYYPL